MATLVRTVTLKKQAEDQIARFDIHQRIQHGMMMISFIFLVLTGFPLKFSSAGISQWWVALWGGIEATRAVHYAAAWVMVASCLYHGGYLLYTVLVLKRPFPIRIFPTPRDARDFFLEIMYFTGLRKEGPHFDRFSWREKFDYWAIFWGIPIMAGSGFILMFPVAATNIFPGWIVPVALIAHSDEAMLALTWIFMVHIFFTHLAPGIFPLNKSMFTGKVSRERYIREHPLEYERMVSVRRPEPEPEAEPVPEFPAPPVTPGPEEEKETE
ncbi:MAG: cytochrome b/b6 domain-containing protein [Chloroflexi bacterium]|nr:cytochrome b/b6 domain-containing protein [Chloroflexota bacterium]